MFSCDRIRSPFPVCVDFVPLLEAAQRDLFSEDTTGSHQASSSNSPYALPDVRDRTLASAEGYVSGYLIELKVTASYESAVCDAESGVHHEFLSRRKQSAFSTQAFGPSGWGGP